MSTPQSKQQTSNNGVAICLHCCERKRKVTRNFCDTCEAKGDAIRFREHVAEALSMAKSKAPVARQTDGGRHIKWDEIKLFDSHVFEFGGRVYATTGFVVKHVGHFCIQHGKKRYSPIKHNSIDSLIDYVCQETGTKRPIVPLDLIDANDFMVIERTKDHRLCIIGGREIKLPPAAIPNRQKKGSRRKILIRILLPFRGTKTVFRLCDYRTLDLMIADVWRCDAENRRKNQ